MRPKLKPTGLATSNNEFLTKKKKNSHAYVLFTLKLSQNFHRNHTVIHPKEEDACMHACMEVRICMCHGTLYLFLELYFNLYECASSINLPIYLCIAS